MYNLTPHGLVIANANWYNVDQLVQVIYFLRNINFNVVEQRQQALERLSKLARTAPFGKSSRFKEGLWVCESLGDWTRKFQQLKSALSYKDVDSQKEKVSSDQRGDSQTAFWNATTSMLDQITALDNVYSREVFESYYCEWVGNDDNDRFAERLEELKE